MPAFNARLTPTEFAGMPALGAGCLVGALLAGVFTLPTWGGIWGWLFAALTLALLLAGGVIIAVGEDLPFVRFRLATAHERHARTIEAVETE
jgi:hypothetical protein